MTQKYVKRTLNGTSGYASIDLYFPQFNIGIEVDEAHHISQEELDRLRTEDIVSAIDGYNERRIIVSNRTILEINDDINKEDDNNENSSFRALQRSTTQQTILHR